MAGGIPKQILAAIRMANGALALFAPNILGKRLGVDTRSSPGLGYAFRLFGVRTLLLGINLWRAPDDPADAVVKEAIVVHASDTAAAIAVQRLKELPARGAVMAIAASALNTFLALLTNWRLRRRAGR